MFARRVSVQLKPNKVAQFIKTLEMNGNPFLRKREGFRDEITFAARPRGHSKPAIATDPRLRDFLVLRFAHIPAAAIA